MTTTRVPFLAADLAVLHRETAIRPWNAVILVVTRSAIDEHRLRAAVQAVCARHPMARARWDGDPASKEVPVWTIPDELDLDPVSVRTLDDDDGIDQLTAELMSTPIPLHRSPPLRLVLARRAAGDVLGLAHSHVAMDGLSTVRLYVSMARAYRSQPDPGDPVDFAVARGLAPEPGGEPPPPSPVPAAGRGGKLGILTDLARQVARPAAVLSPEGEPGARRSGFAYRNLGRERSDAVMAARPPGTTLNDVLVAAMHLTAERWNTEHGRPPGRIDVAVPISTRPLRWKAEVAGNYISTRTTTTHPADRRDLPSACEAIRGQVDSWRAQPAPKPAVHATAAGPLKRALPKLLATATRGRILPTATVSNIGRMPADLRFDDDPPAEIRAYAPAPHGVGIVPLVNDGAVELSFHVERQRMSADATKRIVDLYVDVLPG